MKTFSIEVTGSKRAMRDARLNVETYDFAYLDPAGGNLPGNLVAPPWSPAAVSAHTNAAISRSRFCQRAVARLPHGQRAPSPRICGVETSEARS
jgi:hypothetical protein